jgi:tRNA pseudouridine38-40 synthase
LNSLQRYVLQISFDGTPFNGWQRQKNAPSVQQEIEEKLSIILGKETTVTGCGRTDTGVHANEFFLHFDADKELSNYTHLHKLNTMLPPQIAVQNIYKVSLDFNTRFDALNREYVYLIHFNKNPFLIDKSLKLGKKNLDVNKMNQAANLLLEVEDFTSFSKVKTQTKTNNCDVTFAYWENIENGIKFTIKANRFLRNMVRAIVGTCLAVGEGKMEIEEFKHVIENKNRQSAGTSVPACGLYLNKVTYPNNVFNV